MDATEIVERYSTAFDEGDLATVRSLLAEDLEFTGPLMSATSRDEFFQQLQGFEMEATTHVRRVIGNGSSVARIFDFNLTAPVETTIPMAEWLEVEDGKIQSIELYYDAALFPKG